MGEWERDEREREGGSVGGKEEAKEVKRHGRNEGERT